MIVTHEARSSYNIIEAQASLLLLSGTGTWRLEPPYYYYLGGSSIIIFGISKYKKMTMFDQCNMLT
jgi:hypothetical protein